MPGDADLLLSTLAICGAVAVVALVAIAVHEFAHAAAAVLVGFRPTSIHIGSGPCIWARWIRNVRLELHSDPWAGRVEFVPRARSHLKLRLLAVYLAGPCSVVALAAACWAIESSVRMPFVEAKHIADVPIPSIVLTLIAVLGFAPIRRGQVVSDTLLCWRTLRTDRAQLADWATSFETLDLVERMTQSFLLGKREEFDEFAQRLAARHLGAPVANGFRALVLTSERNFEGALAAHEDSVAAMRSEVSSSPGTDREREEAENELRSTIAINRAFHLAMLNTAAAIAEARNISNSWVRPGGMAIEGGVAAERTRGLVLLLDGDVERGSHYLRKALAAEEPYWLRALTMSFLALGHALQKEPRAAQRLLRRARRLHPQSLLIPLIAKRVEAALATA